VGKPERSLFENDYISYFGLNARPFSLTPDPAFYFPSLSHRRAFDTLHSFVLEDQSIALVFGEVGTGKTILCRHFLSSLNEERFATGLIVAPITDERESFAEMIARSVGVEPGCGRDHGVELKQRFLRSSLTGRRTVLAIDEAQVLTAPLLEFLAELFPEASVTPPLLQVILFAQKEMVGRLLNPAMRAVRRAITTTHCLDPLASEEVGSYVEHRLAVAGSRGQIRFTGDALRILFDCSEGFPRIINNLCDRLLLVLSSRSERTVDRKIMKRVLKEFGTSRYS
jgi:type II secretory pathway predicted ATPase ExeA